MACGRFLKYLLLLCLRKEGRGTAERTNRVVHKVCANSEKKEKKSQLSTFLQPLHHAEATRFSSACLFLPSQHLEIQEFSLLPRCHFLKPKPMVWKSRPPHHHSCPSTGSPSAPTTTKRINIQKGTVSNAHLLPVSFFSFLIHPNLGAVAAWPGGEVSRRQDVARAPSAQPL